MENKLVVLVDDILLDIDRDMDSEITFVRKEDIVPLEDAADF